MALDGGNAVIVGVGKLMPRVHHDAERQGSTSAAMANRPMNFERRVEG